jgi:hypothetical protein
LTPADSFSLLKILLSEQVCIHALSPKPGTLALLGLGLACLGFSLRRKV